jgi:selenide,water dikinase
VLGSLPRVDDARVLAGFDTSEDCGVYLVRDDLAMVQTIDILTPVVDNPFVFGQIAASNALSDVFAMGARPLTALSFVGFPRSGLGLEVLEQMHRGGLDKLTEAGTALLGGHSIADKEIKFGYAITGEVHPGGILRNAGARPGDSLVLTKPLGIGVLTHGVKEDKTSPRELDAAVAQMIRLNMSASRRAREFGASAVTDVTGFGLVVHALEMARGSGVDLELDSAAVPLLPGALRVASEGCMPGAVKTNREFGEGHVTYAGSVDENLQRLLNDPQTAGGLLIAVDAGSAGRLVRLLKEDGGIAAVVGRVVGAGKCPAISVR